MDFDILNIGIKEVCFEYLASPTANINEVSYIKEGWTNCVPRLNRNNKYLWNRSKIVYTNGEEVLTTPSFIHEYTNSPLDRLIIFIKSLFR